MEPSQIVLTELVRPVCRGIMICPVVSHQTVYSAVMSMKFAMSGQRIPFAEKCVLCLIPKNVHTVYANMAYVMNQKGFIMKASPVYPTLTPWDVSNILKTETSWLVIHKTPLNTASNAA